MNNVFGNDANSSQINFIRYEAGLIIFEIGNLRWSRETTTAGNLLLPTGDTRIIISGKWRLNGPRKFKGPGKLNCSYGDDFRLVGDSLAVLMNKKIVSIEHEKHIDNISIKIECGFCLNSYDLDGVSSWKMIDSRTFLGASYSYKKGSIETTEIFDLTQVVAA